MVTTSPSRVPDTRSPLTSRAAPAPVPPPAALLLLAAGRAPTAR